jgi:hypothetical protein
MNLGRNCKWLLFAFLFLIFWGPSAHSQNSPGPSATPGPTPRQKSIPPDVSPQASMRASIANQLTGTWRLIAYQEKLENGSVVNPYGETPQGIAIFEPGGYVSVQVMKIPRVSFPAGYDRATVEQVKAVHEAYLAYYGTWAVDEGHTVVVENIRGSNQPYLNNQITTQMFDFDGKRLNLRTVFDNHGEEHSVLFVWEKIH